MSKKIYPNGRALLGRQFLAGPFPAAAASGELPDMHQLLLVEAIADAVLESSFAGRERELVRAVSTKEHARPA